MWLLNQLDKLNLNEKGLQISVDDIYNPTKPSLTSAIVLLGGGTASFVSPQGLILTNHHVAYTALQRSSNSNSDILTNGFLAKNRSEEIQAPGYQALMLIEMKDVTDEVLSAGNGAADITERNRKINVKISQMTKEIEKDKEDIQANVSSNYNGRQYILYVYQVFKDIRIVYSPPLSIGKYGGEIDNWMWPRHTGDFSYMRAYVSPDGKGKEYNPENVPYQPKVWLKVSNDELKDGDFTFIIGFPGFTTRFRTSNSASWNYKYNYPFTIKNFKEIIDLLDETTKNNTDGKIKVANLKTGLANTLKNFEGKVTSMRKLDFVQKKLDFEKELMVWINKDSARKEKYGNIINDIKKEYDVLRKTLERDNVAGLVQQGLVGMQLSVASQIYNTVKEREKPEGERLPGFSEENVNQAIEQLKFTYADYFEPTEKALMVRMLKMADALPSDQRIDALEFIFNDKSKSIEQFTESAFKSSKLDNIDYAKELFNKTTKELAELNDPFFNIVIKMDPLFDEINKVANDFGIKVTNLRKQYIDALYDWKGTNLYPDANRTIRFSYGNVKGYTPADAVWYFPFTTLKGAVEKNTGVEPFDVPPALVDLYNKKDYGKWMDSKLKDVPIAFTHICDLTGGSSGSPVMNAKGELVGIAFDGNFEGMISDWQFDANIQRAISVDIRYVMFITDKFSKAGFLLDEMGVKH